VNGLVVPCMGEPNMPLAGESGGKRVSLWSSPSVDRDFFMLMT
jgi:hypothetical protein